MRGVALGQTVAPSRGLRKGCHHSSFPDRRSPPNTMAGSMGPEGDRTSLILTLKTLMVS